MTTSEFFQIIYPNDIINNVSDSNTNFKFIFPQPIHLACNYEVSIHESFIPYSIFNIPNNEYMQIEVYGSERQLNTYDNSPKRNVNITKAEIGSEIVESHYKTCPN
jgi:hypothetical protein